MKAENLINNKGMIMNGVKLISHDIFHDNRGFFFEDWNKNDFEKVLKQNYDFCQLNHSFSYHGVIRGLHYQLNPEPQGKLIRCLRGKIYDVVVDLRKDSLTFSSWVGIELREEEYKSLWIPPGFAHGFLAQSKKAEIQYFVTSKWNQELEKCIIWNDPQLNIEWPIDDLKVILSSKDLEGIKLCHAEALGYIF